MDWTIRCWVRLVECRVESWRMLGMCDDLLVFTTTDACRYISSAARATPSWLRSQGPCVACAPGAEGTAKGL